MENLLLRKHRYKKACTAEAVQADFRYAPGGTRTPNLLIRSQMLYPIELRAHKKTWAVQDSNL